MEYDLDGVCQDCIYLEKVKVLFEEKNNKIEHLKEKIKEIEQDRDENYVLKQNDPYSEYGISEKDFH